MLSSSTGSNPPKKRLLFLHGMALPPYYYTDKLARDLFQGLTSEFQVEFCYSPRRLTAQIPNLDKLFPDLQPDEMREWFNSHTNNDHVGSKRYEGLQESLTFLQDYLNQQPRFDVLAGHSNGALMAAILSFFAKSVPDWLPESKHWSSVVLCNAPASFDTEQTLSSLIQEAQQGPVVPLPSVHVWGGESDHCWEGQQALQTIHFPTNAAIINHRAGHLFPSNAETNQKIVKAISESVLN